jgi:hypothetical protein
MARTKKKIILTPPEHTYYAYFNPETEQFFSSSNVHNTSYTHYAIIKKTDHEDICSGKLNLSDLVLDKFVDFDGTMTYKIITSQMYDAVNFHNTLLEWVSDTPSETTEFIIEWDNANQQWAFYVTELGRSMLNGAMYNTTLAFFIILETDFDFLVRTFYIKIHDVLKVDKLVFDFESKLETNIRHLSISTKRFFNNYGLKIND